MVTDGEGNIANGIALEDAASKGRSGRYIPMSAELKTCLQQWAEEAFWTFPNVRVIHTERSKQTSPQAIVNMFGRWYRELGFQGCSSHSGRRTFITSAARKISSVGGSLRDVQLLAGHTSLRVTQGYIDGEQEAQRRIVELI